MRRSVHPMLICSVPFLLILTGCQTESRRPVLTVLDKSLQPIRERFNAESGKPRIIGFFSPT